MQTLDLLFHRNLKQPNVDFWIFLSAPSQQRRQARGRNAIGQSDAQLVVKAIGRRLDAIPRQLQCGKDAGHVLQKPMPRLDQTRAARGANEERCAGFFLQLFDRARKGRLVDM